MVGYPGLLLALLILLLGACGVQVAPGVTRVTFEELKPPPPGPVQAAPYRIRDGDVLSINFISNPELDVTVPVRADGKISLAVVGEVTAAGLTLAELQAAVSERYKRFSAETRYGEVFKEGDDLQIRFLYNPELNQALTIRADGRISLPLIGEIEAAGVRPADLRRRLIEDYSRYIKKLDVTVLVGGNVTKKIFADEAFILVTLSKPAGREVFVGGEVLAPRAVKFDGRLTALQAIMQAGGVKETGDLSRIVVLRRGQFEHGEWIQTNLSKPLSGKNLENDVVLRSGDVVLVPMSGIAKLDLYVKQYIRDLLPLQSSFSVTVEAFGRE